MIDPVRILVGDVMDGLRSLPDGSVHCAVTSPPYWGLRDYGVEGQIGLERTPDEFIAKMVEVFREVRRVLRDDGTLWLNIGDSYSGSGRGGNPTDSEHPKQATNRDCIVGQTARDAAVTNTGRQACAELGMKPKDLCMMPWRVAMALQADGWWLRSVIVWAKKSPMPESVTDRPTSSWEPIFLLAKSARYYYDAEAVKEEGNPASAERYKYAFAGAKDGLSRPDGGERMCPEGMRDFDGRRNLRNVWTLGPEPYSEAHFATFPTEIPRRAIKAGTSEKGCCPACGAGWVRVVERRNCARSDATEYANGLGNVATARTRTAMHFVGGESCTTGWRPGCGCAAGEPVPCVVLDPFLGSGTTVAVARELGRYGVGCELNQQYADLARIRIGKAERPSTFVDPREKDAPLFGIGGVA